MVKEVLEIQHGIWIDEQWIREAGLEGRVRVLVQHGEIRILPGADDNEPKASANGWDVFRTLGVDALPGKLENAAEEHDHFLYGKDE